MSKFSYPSDKRLNANVTKSLQEAEHNLDAFWKEVDDQFIKNDGESPYALLANILPHRDIQRTPDWVEPREGVANRGSRTEDLSAQVALLELEARTEKTVDPEALAPRPPKVKTRAEAAPSEPPQAQPPEEPAQPPKSTVSKRGLKVFSTLFYSPSGGDPPG